VLSLDEVRKILETHESKIQLGNSPSAQIQDILGKRKDRDTPDDVTCTSKRARLDPVKEHEERKIKDASSQTTSAAQTPVTQTANRSWSTANVFQNLAGLVPFVRCLIS
jgi:hypothetical protein